MGLLVIGVSFGYLRLPSFRLERVDSVRALDVSRLQTHGGGVVIILSAVGVGILNKCPCLLLKRY